MERLKVLESSMRMSPKKKKKCNLVLNLNASQVVFLCPDTSEITFVFMFIKSIRNNKLGFKKLLFKLSLILHININVKSKK